MTTEVLETAFKKLATQRIQLLLETCDRALDVEACRADEAERRLESVRETLAAVRAQHEAIFNRYEELKASIQVDSSMHTIPPIPPSARKFQPEAFSAPAQRPNGAGESVVQRMRAQLEQSAKKTGSSLLFGTPIAESKRPKTKLGTLSKNYL